MWEASKNIYDSGLLSPYLLIEQNVFERWEAHLDAVRMLTHHHISAQEHDFPTPENPTPDQCWSASRTKKTFYAARH